MKLGCSFADCLTECAAEATGRPLILLTIADIGLDEKKIEEQMTKWFNLAERWGAILLIDEADIFLERRRGADIARNGLVSGKKFALLANLDADMRLQYSCGKWSTFKVFCFLPPTALAKSTTHSCLVSTL
jgi:hypothetical protein